jgi:hypothetical protein
MTAAEWAPDLERERWRWIESLLRERVQTWRERADKTIDGSAVDWLRELAEEVEEILDAAGPIPAEEWLSTALTQIEQAGELLRAIKLMAAIPPPSPKERGTTTHEPTH